MSVSASPAAPSPAATALSGHGDGVLIELYRTEREPEAMRTLVERHHDPVYRRLRRELFDEADAEICSQKLWIRVMRHLDEWTHLAELNGVDVGEAWALFESARGRLIGGARSASSTVLDEEEMPVFLVRTQAQRAVGTERFSWDRTAELLGVPVGTLKRRYRAAEKRLADALEEYRRTR